MRREKAESGYSGPDGLETSLLVCPDGSVKIGVSTVCAKLYPKRCIVHIPCNNKQLVEDRWLFSCSGFLREHAQNEKGNYSD